MRRSGRLIGPSSRPRVEDFREARLVRIAHRRFTIWLDPFGMLDPQIVVNLLQQVRVSVDFLGHDHIDSLEFKCAGGGFPVRESDGIVYRR